MISARNLTISISLAVLSAARFICAQDAKPSEVGVILPLPLVIQQLELQPQRSFDFLFQAAPGVGPFDLCARSSQVPGVSIWNEPARGCQTGRCGTV
jgi:hypothetical protein